MERYNEKNNGFSKEGYKNSVYSLARIEIVPFEVLERLHSILRKAGLILKKEHNPKTSIGFFLERLTAAGISSEQSGNGNLQITFPSKNGGQTPIVSGTSEQIYKAYFHYENIMKRKK